MELSQQGHSENLRGEEEEGEEKMAHKRRRRRRGEGEEDWESPSQGENLRVKRGSRQHNKNS